MRDGVEPLGLLLEKVARDVGDGASGERRQAQRMAAAAAMGLARRRREVRRARWAGAAVMTAMGTVALLFHDALAAREGLAFRIKEADESPRTTAWVQAPPAEERHVIFEQGSLIKVEERSSLQVESESREGVLVRLKSGVVAADIVGNGRTKWVVVAGPYRVKVLGTRFTVSWQAASGILDVSVSRGRVLVQGPGTVEAGVVVAGGSRLRAHRRDGAAALVAPSETFAPVDDAAIASEPTAAAALETGSPTAEPPAPEIVPMTRSAAPQAPLVARSRAPREPSPRDEQAPAPSWLALYEDGEAEAAVTAAAALGIDMLTETLESNALWKLQDAVRITGRREMSSRILLRYRERFPEGKHAPTAGFLLGRAACDGARFGEAARWFRAYLAEAPDGPLTEEAIGRLIIVYEKSGQKTLAKSAAKQYLAQYSEGVYQQIARAAIDEE